MLRNLIVGIKKLIMNIERCALALYQLFFSKKITVTCLQHHVLTRDLI